MHSSNSNFAIPGFQTPDHPKADERVVTRADGLVDFEFLKDRPLDETMPPIVTYISIERGNQNNLMAVAETTKYIYEEKQPERNLKSYWFRLRLDEQWFFPGTFAFTFLVNGQEVAKKWVTIESGPAVPRPFDTAICPYPIKL